jgi:nucleoside-diphosphate kinase
MEKTLIILKPDAVDRRLVGETILRFERKGLQILGMKLAVVPRSTAEKHYEAHRAKPFYSSLVQFMTAGPVVLMVLGGSDAIQVSRRLMGDTAATKAPPGTIRGDFGLSSQFNLVHGSDSPEAAQREIELFFSPDEIIEYRSGDARWFAAQD